MALVGTTALVLAASVWTAVHRFGGRGSEPRAEPQPEAQVPAAAFSDVTLAAGIDFVHRNGAEGGYHLFEIMGGGGAFVDFDADGWLDVFLVQSGAYEREELGEPSRLYRNDGAGRFQDVTDASGAGVGGYGMGCAVGDYDADGFPDLLVTRVGRDVLLHNRGDGTFEDVTAAAGLDEQAYSSSAAWLDYDSDGRLDLYVAHYTELTPESQVSCKSHLGHPDYCDPSVTAQTRDSLYRNLGDGRFEDVSVAAGIALRTGYGLAVTCADFDSDGWLDLYVANDQSPAFLWRNRGDGRFEDIALQAGCAYNGHGVAIAGMGIVAEDLDEDGDVDLFVTNLREFSNLFLRNDGGAFADVGFLWGKPTWMNPYTGFGAVALDQDNDGRLELFVVNGAVSRSGAADSPEEVYAEPNQFLRREESGRFVSAQAELGPELGAPGVSRGLASGDYDNDGDVDLLVCRNGARPQLLRNEQRGDRHWLSVLPLDGAGRAPVFNARVAIEVGARRRWRECRASESYLVSTDPRVHFGLGAEPAVDRIRVRWPDGSLEWFPGAPADQFLTVQRGEGSPEPGR